jgi:ABC-type polysaccharide/polyol phosphate transport system ATPase subunit
MNDDIAISIKNLTKSYKLYRTHADRVKETFHPFRKKYHQVFNALNNISIEIKKGESVGIIGRNGSGKSTLLQIICNILKPSSGYINTNGSISALLELGAGFNPEFTGKENIYLNMSIIGFDKGAIDDKYAEIIEFADIGAFINQPVKTYSSGMFIRLAFAIAVCVKPQILIVDEALSVGDIFFQQKCIHHMEQIMGDCTNVLVSHDMHMISNLCNRVFVLDKGELVFESDPLKAAEYYTKIMHNEQFGAIPQDEPKSLSGDFCTIKNELEWIDVDSDSKAGAGEIRIEKVCLVDQNCVPVQVLKKGDYLQAYMLIRISRPKKNLIFGYTIRDRVGNAIFGENTFNTAKGRINLKKGVFIVRMDMNWPEIHPDKYTMTLGVGEGIHPLNHVIQCWAHNVLSIESISPDNPIHGIFNNPIVEYEVSKIG